MKEDTRPDMQIGRLDDDELRKFVVDCLGGRIFTSAQVRDFDHVPMVFMVVALGGLSQFSAKSMNDIGIIYEYIEKAGPRSINGYPTFFSFRVLHVLDWEIALKMLVAEEKRQSQLDVPR
jgi:hypothetical protein